MLDPAKPASLRVAAVQMSSKLDKPANWDAAERLVAEAAAGGAELVVLPEMFDLYGDLRLAAEQAEPIPGPTSQRLSAWAARHQIWLCGGSLSERAAGCDRAFNASVLLDDRGQIVAKYRKLHLFDADLAGQVSVQESAHFAPGEQIVCTCASRGTFGQAICYDLRFPELFRALSERGMEALLFPSAFTQTTGQDHWEILVRARAIENQCFVVAANQAGRHTDKSESYGHSLIVDPWGRILAAAGEQPEAVLHATLEFALLDRIRARLPALAHRRLTPTR
jgi:predicted amidohydrolase